MSVTDRPAAPTRPVEEVPGPRGIPVLGNAREIHRATMIQDLMELTSRWGPMFRLQTPSGSTYVASGLARGSVEVGATPVTWDISSPTGTSSRLSESR